MFCFASHQSCHNGWASNILSGGCQRKQYPPRLNYWKILLAFWAGTFGVTIWDKVSCFFPEVHDISKEWLYYNKYNFRNDSACQNPLYSVSPSPGSDVAQLFAKLYSKWCALSEMAHTDSHAHKNKECVHGVHALTSCVCMRKSLPGDGRWSI